MPTLIRLALAFDLSALWFETSFPQIHGILPLAGNPVSQMLIFLLGAALLLEFIDLAKNLYRAKPKQKIRRRPNK